MQKKTSQSLTNKHKAKRLHWAKEHISWKLEWHVVWSDENKFNLDSPDGWNYY